MELFWEGGFVSGGCYGRAVFLVVLLWLTLSPSWCSITLRGRNRPLGLAGMAGFWWFCPDWEGSFESGGWNCLGRVLLPRIFPGRACLPDVTTLPVQNRPPGLFKIAAIWA
ncbi:hypothetical protein [Varibaculum sp.]|uniref:hypothetical protein n=1 Tax=Varibaculum sp. TaxID=1895474 RepID=UPI002600133F|nr:hypothetical protein [Varibaculum sp.]